jgi:hypothetical protein
MQYSPEQIAAAYKKAVSDGDIEAANELGNLLESVTQSMPMPEPIVGGNKEQIQRQRQEIAQIRYGTPGRDIDVKTGLPAATRAIMSFMPSEEDKIQYLQNQYGAENVSQRGPDGRMVVTAFDANSGTPKDYFVDEIGFTGKDLLDYAGSAPEVLTTIATAVRSAPLFGKAKAGALALSALSEVAGQTVGTIQDIVARASQDRPIDLGEIAERRGVNATIGTVLGGVSPGAANFIVNRLRSLSSGVRGSESAIEAIAQEGSEAAGRLETRLGIPVPMTAAQESGSRGLAEMEAYARRTSRVTNPTEGMESQQERVRRELPALFGESAPDYAQLGSSIQNTLRKRELAMAERTGLLLDDAFVSVVNRLEKNFPILNTSETATNAGNLVRRSMQTNLAEKKAQESLLYKETDRLIEASRGTRDPAFVSLSSTRGVARDIISQSAKTSSGKPIMMQEGAISQAKSLLDAAEVPQTLQGAIRLRSQIGSAISRGEPIAPGVGVGDAKRLYASLSTDIDRSIGGLSKEAQAAARKANNFFRDNLKEFEESGVISKMAFEESSGGFANTAEIPRYFMAGRGRLNELKSAKKFFGAPEYFKLRNSMVSDVINSSKRTVGGVEYTDYSSLRNKLTELSPEFKKELFGSQKAYTDIERFLNEAGTIDQYRPKFGKINGLNQQQIADLFSFAGTDAFPTTASNIRKAIAIEAQRTRTFRGSVLGANRDVLGVLLGDGEKFVNDFIFNSTNPREVRLVMNRLTPQQRNQLSNATASMLFQRAIDTAESTVSSLKGGVGAAVKPEQVLKSIYGNQRGVMQEVLRPDQLDLIDDWMKYTHALAAVNKAGGTVGVFSRDLNMSNPVKVAAQNIWANLLFSGKAQAFLKSAYKNPNALKQVSRTVSGFSPRQGLGIAGITMAPDMSREALNIYGEWERMTDGMSSVERDILLTTFMPFN